MRYNSRQHERKMRAQKIAYFRLNFRKFARKMQNFISPFAGAYRHRHCRCEKFTIAGLPSSTTKFCFLMKKISSTNGVSPLGFVTRMICHLYLNLIIHKTWIEFAIIICINNLNLGIVRRIFSCYLKFNCKSFVFSFLNWKNGNLLIN